MHISGKILLFLAIVGGGAAAAFMAQTMKVRNSWMQKNAALRKSNLENAKSIAQQEAELQKLQAELKRTLMNWGTPINRFNMTQANATSVRFPIGAVEGVVAGQTANPLLHAFRPVGDDGTFVYVGPLRIQSVTDNDTETVPTWTVRAGEVDPWNQQNQQWRVWQRVPARGVTRFTDLQQALVSADQRLVDKNNYLTKNQGLLAGAKKQNQERLGELLGPNNKPPIPAKLDGMEVTHGLLSAIAAEEESRNSLQANIDQLRRRLKLAFATLEGTSKNNDALIKDLPALATQPSAAPKNVVSAEQ